jgi:hypothetical protein
MPFLLILWQRYILWSHMLTQFSSTGSTHLKYWIHPINV